MILKNRTLQLDGAQGPILLWRTDEGVVQVQADSLADLHMGQGYAHAHDRIVQMLLVRLIGQGRLAECLSPDPGAVAVDVFMRRMGMARDARQDVANLNTGALESLEAYAAGVNLFLDTVWPPPLELLLTGYSPERWSVADTLLTIKIMSYVGLAQAQQDTEKWIIQAVANGVDLDRLRDLFTPHLDGFDPSWIEGLKIAEPALPDGIKWLPVLPRMVASNNWVVAGSRTASGFPMLCNDPHLEINRLPPIWYEVVLAGDDNVWMGASMPGSPGIVVGRSKHVAVGITYGFADQIDYFIEDCRDGAFRRGDEWVPFEKRTETIQRKGQSALHIDVYENLHGVLEGDPTVAGKYLCRAWSGHRNGASPSMNALQDTWLATTAEDAMKALAPVGLSSNWVVADREHIGYQQSGTCPIRPAGWSGLFPVPGWDEHWDWQGMHPPQAMSRVLDPEEGFIVTANDDWNDPGKARPINLCMSDYRASRIRQMLSETSDCTHQDMARIHTDLLSLQAQRFMEVLRPLLPDDERGRRFAGWNCIYSAGSLETAWFEAIYAELKREVFGRGFIGADAWRHTEEETGLMADFHGHFDRILLEGDPSWFQTGSRDELLRRVAASVLAGPTRPGDWGAKQEVTMTHILLGEKLPSFLGFNREGLVLPGSRATVPQAQIYRSGGRLTSFAPSWRFITDMAESRARSCLAGGVSGDRFSPWYLSDVERFTSGEYKVLYRGDPPPGTPLRPGMPGPNEALAWLPEILNHLGAALTS